MMSSSHDFLLSAEQFKFHTLVAVRATSDVRWFSSCRGRLVAKIEKKKFYILSFFSHV